jgi:hypothetical protein
MEANASAALTVKSRAILIGLPQRMCNWPKASAHTGRSMNTREPAR